MAEYIGARISLISKSDIRYVGTLHEINSTDSTVALENVRSMGTEDRRTGPGSIAPNERLYEYIRFRGSDVKDLRIEEPAKQAPQQESEVPDDPAILGSTRPPQQSGTPQQSHQPPFGQPPPYAGHGFPPYPPPMHGQGFGRGGFPPGGPGFGYPGPGPYSAPPPGWFPPGQGFPPGPGGPGPFSPHGPPGMPPQQQPPRQQATPVGPAKDGKGPEQKKGQPPTAPPESSKAPATAPAPAEAPAPTPPVETKPDVAAAIAPPAAPKQAPPTGPRNRAPIPINPAARAGPSNAAAVQTQNAQTAANNAQSFASATQAATAAVAAAMAKLPMAQKMGQAQPDGGAGAVDNLAKKVQEMRTDDQIRHGRQQGTGGHVAGHRGRGRGRGGHHQQSRPVEVPATDYDFESANAKFNKEDLVKEVIATGSPLGTPGESSSAANGGAQNGGAPESESATAEEVVIPKAEAVYNKKSSFFDNISSELKDRDEKRGQEFRSEERRKNMETFGQGSVDNNYRRGYGRGRGRGFRGSGGRGGFGQRGGGGYRGRGGATAADV